MISEINNKKNFSKTQQFYDKLLEDEDHYGAKKYKHGWAGNFHRYRIKLLRDIFLNTLHCQKNTEILDIGSGVSMFGEIFPREKCPEITAFDIADVVIERGKKINPHIKFLVDDAQNPSLKGEWNVVFAGEIIEHLAKPEIALKNWAKLVKKGGHLVVTTPNRFFNRKTQEHISLLTIGQMRKNLQELDFEITQIIGIDIFNPLLDWFLNKIVERFPKFSRISDRIFQIKMRLTYKLPWLAPDIIYVARKQ